MWVNQIMAAITENSGLVSVFANIMRTLLIVLRFSS